MHGPASTASDGKNAMVSSAGFRPHLVRGLASFDDRSIRGTCACHVVGGPTKRREHSAGTGAAAQAGRQDRHGNKQEGF